jgi:hypothetical protein
MLKMKFQAIFSSSELFRSTSTTPVKTVDSASDYLFQEVVNGKWRGEILISEDFFVLGPVFNSSTTPVTNLGPTLGYIVPKGVNWE